MEKERGKEGKGERESRIELRCNAYFYRDLL